MNYEIIFADSFKRQFKKLKKKYPQIREDLNPFFVGIEEGKFPGDSIPGLLNRVYKFRCPSSDMKRGKRGGCRVIYYLQGQDNKVYLISIYSKALRENIPVNVILDLLKELGLKLK